jgi:hypothetical protein
MAGHYIHAFVLGSQNRLVFERATLCATPFFYLRLYSVNLKFPYSVHLASFLITGFLLPPPPFLLNR